MRWDPDIQGGSGGGWSFSTSLLPLPGPPGWASGDGGERPKPVGVVEEQGSEREEIRKKILENQVKPGEFKQTVPKAPEGPATVLPICPPAAALERIAVTVKAKAPATNPVLYLNPANGNDPWAGWSITGQRPIPSQLVVVAPEVVENGTTPTVEPINPAPSPAVGGQLTANTPAEDSVRRGLAENGSKPIPAALVSAAKSVVVTPSKPFTEPPKNYKAAEALKSAAQATFFEAAIAKPPVPQPDQPSPRRHEVFVDLSVLGIEEDEDADAESLAREGESPPGVLNGKPARRRNSAAREAVRELVSLPHAPVTPAAPKLVHSFPGPRLETDGNAAGSSVRRAASSEDRF